MWSEIKTFVKESLIAGLAMNGIHITPKKEKPNVYCIRLSAEHNSLPIGIMNWSNTRINKLKLSGASTKVVSAVTQRDAEFINSLSNVLADVAQKNNRYDAWLFFKDSILDSDFLELQCMPRGSKVADRILIISHNNI